MLKRAFFVAFMANISLALPTIKYQDSLEVLEVEIEQNLNEDPIEKGFSDFVLFLILGTLH